ncbi:hypothetical protein UA08_03015 [Talaromyces atroroseus]|uniref:Pentatricopeptide repeat-containing protein-mitochondrial domain-containing protein n=1 Tax=Talaromyces atroroseus TaxID=1441469 RepID=A0A225AR05_TALAT|nr:hypothetical protein UA08_03015 [Talaromyces atroroseus]OKL61933.1 hypothetical protein UA08_03015 [Talaromyces atroroseus]
MRRSPLTLDGLWYCLCPSFRRSYLKRPSLSFRLIKEASRRFQSSAFAGESQHFDRHSRDNKAPEDHGYSEHPALRLHRSRTSTIERLQSLSVSELENRLAQLSSRRQTDVYEIIYVLKELLQKHRISPTTRHYRAYVLGNIDRRHGSPGIIRGLLHEMEKEGITADSATLHAALEAIAVHPDYLLRQEVIGALRARWLSLSPAGWHHLIAGLVREGQLELALDRLDQMERKGIPLEQWLHGLLIYKLCDAGEFTEALNLMRSRSKKAVFISWRMWSYLLRAAIQNSHFDTVRYVWTNAVDLGYTVINVSDCRDVLRLASEHGDINFLESVFRHLFTLDNNLDRKDYERLVQLYARNADITTALEIICRMHQSKLSLSPETTQSVLLSLESRINDPEIMWKEISSLKNKGLRIPVALANLVINYCGILLDRGSMSASRATDIAIDIYKDLYEVCSSGASTETFNSLFTLCRQAKKPDVCTFFAKEMAAFDVSPDQETFETLILICSDVGSFSTASMYLTDLRARGWELSLSVADQLRRKCGNIDNQDAVALCQLLGQI